MSEGVYMYTFHTFFVYATQLEIASNSNIIMTNQNFTAVFKKECGKTKLFKE